jgi:hypothetical protein
VHHFHHTTSITATKSHNVLALDSAVDCDLAVEAIEFDDEHIWIAIASNSRAFAVAKAGVAGTVCCCCCCCSFQRMQRGQSKPEIRLHAWQSAA